MTLSDSTLYIITGLVSAVKARTGSRTCEHKRYNALGQLDHQQKKRKCIVLVIEGRRSLEYDVIMCLSPPCLGG